MLIIIDNVTKELERYNIMNRIQKALSVLSLAAVSLFLPCAAAPMFGPAFPDIDDDGSSKAKTSKSSNTANKSAAAPAAAPAAVAPPPAPVPVPPPPPASVPAPVIVDEEEYDDSDEFGDRPTPVVEADTEPAGESAAAESAPAEKEKKVKKEKVKKEKKEKAEKEVKPPKSAGYVKPIKFGGRLAYNNSYVPALSVDVDELDMAAGDVKGKKHDNKPGVGGSGFEVGAAVELRLAGPLSLYTGLNFAIRNPVAIEGALTISEMAVNVPVLFRVMLAKPVFLDIGGQLDIPFGTKIKRDWGKAENFEGRTTIDGGGVLGIGGYIIENLSIDAKGVIGLRNFDEEHEKPVYQVSIGVSYMY